MLIGTLIGSWDVNAWLEGAFYPALYAILAGASLGIPIPEDVPLIAAGVILAKKPEITSWIGTVLVGLAGVMTGDSIMYHLGRRWGTEAVKHRLVRWVIPRRGLRRMTVRFQRYGAWACFFGRFVMGVRAVMCITAGVTKFPYWKFLIADTAGAMLSVPLFIGLGYGFANVIPTLEAYLEYVKWGLVAAVILGVIGYALARRSPRRRKRRRAARRAATEEATPQAVTGCVESLGLPVALARDGLCRETVGTDRRPATTMPEAATPRSAHGTSDQPPEVLAE